MGTNIAVHTLKRDDLNVSNVSYSRISQ